MNISDMIQWKPSDKPRFAQCKALALAKWLNVMASTYLLGSKYYNSIKYFFFICCFCSADFYGGDFLMGKRPEIKGSISISRMLYRS